jgi:hypothetical protein
VYDTLMVSDTLYPYNRTEGDARPGRETGVMILLQQNKKRRETEGKMSR